MMVFAAALGLGISMLNALSLDIEKGVVCLLNFWMFLTPVVYSADNKTGVVKLILTCNPMTYLHGCARDILVFGNTGSPGAFAGLSVIAFFLLLLSMKWFYVAEERVIEKMM